MMDFLLVMTFQSFCLPQFIPVMDYQYWSCKSRVSVFVLDIKVLVLVLKLLILVLDKQVLNSSLENITYLKVVYVNNIDL